jgi:hypothetical protein
MEVDVDPWSETPIATHASGWGHSICPIVMNESPCIPQLLVIGKGTCSPASNTAIPVGRYAITATYTGNLLGSKSGVVTLTVKK